MREQEVDAGGNLEARSQPSAFHQTIIPSNDDIVMTDQDPNAVYVQGHGSNVRAEIQVISKDEFNMPSETIPNRYLVRRLRLAIKRQEKTVKKQKTTIRDLEDDLSDAELHFQSSRSELKDALKRLAASEQALEGTKAELIQQKRTCRSPAKDLATARQEMRQSKDVVRSLEASNGDLRDKLAASNGELSQCKDDLFRLQKVAQTPDSTVCQELELLSQQIIHWIEAEVAAFEKAHPERPDHIFSAGQDEDASAFLRLNPGASEHLVRHLIHRFLEKYLFGEDMYLLGLKEETTKMLRKAESAMASLDPPRDSATIALWRSETLKALCATTECKDNSKRQVQDLNTHMFQELSRALPILFLDRGRTERFYTQVMVPAAKLATTMRISTSEYVFDSMSISGLTFEPVILDHFKVCQMIDIRSGRHLRPDSAVVADNAGIIGKIVMFLEPGLHRRIDGKYKTLRQTVFLIELKHPLGKRSKTSA